MNNFKIITTLLLSVYTCVSTFANQADVEYGKAAYYADKFHGRKTASGELYDKDGYTCAHKTYPFGTILRVTRLDNQKSIDVRVNDRGPYREGHVVDLSRAAAESIDLIKAGVAQVKVEVAATPPPVVSTGVSSAGTSAGKSVAPVTHSTSSSAQTHKGSTTLLAPVKNTEPVVVTKTAPSPATKKETPTTTAKGAAPAAKTEPVTYSTATEPSSYKSTKPTTADLYNVDVKGVEKKGYGVQLYTLTSSESVLSEIAKLQKTWPGKVLVLRSDNNGVIEHKIIIGPYGDRKAAESQQRIATKKGHSRCFVIDLKA